MTETWCGLLDVLILTVVAGVNGVLIHRTGGMRAQLERSDARRANDADQ